MIAKCLEQRIVLAVAIRKYLQASEQLQRANQEFVQACDELRSQAGTDRRFVAQIDGDYWLLEVDAQGDFDLERIERV